MKFVFALCVALGVLLAGKVWAGKRDRKLQDSARAVDLAFIPWDIRSER